MGRTETQAQQTPPTAAPDWDSVGWLVDHHRTKLAERRAMVADLGLKPGDVVLDLGCGPGLWTPLFETQVAPTGSVIGLDRSLEFVSYGHRHFAGRGGEGIVQFAVADFHAIPCADQSFDAVFFGNCSAYVTHPVELLAEHRRITKKGGRVIAKDFDGAILVFHPMDPVLSLEVLAANSRSLAERPPDPPFDNFVGRKLHGIFLQAGFQEVSTASYAIQKLAPLSEEAKRYITGNAIWYADVAGPFLSEHSRQRWLNHFRPGSDEYILDRPDFYFAMLEVVTCGRV